MTAMDKEKGQIVESRYIEQNIQLPYKWFLGHTFTKFFDEFKNKKIMGTKCPKCSRVLVPARKFCPRCYEDTKEWVQVSDTGTLKTWSLVNFTFAGQVTPPPYITALIDLDGAGTSITHYVGGFDMSDIEKVKARIAIGMKVKAKWRSERKGHILDIEYFEPMP
jgi:uncharacterized protein